MSTHRPCWRRFRQALMALALALLASMPTTGQSQPVDTTSRPGGLFDDVVDPALTRRALPGADIPGIPGITTLRSRLVAIDFGRLAEARLAGGHIDTPTGTAPPLTLTLNLFEDVVLPAVVERTAITASGTGYVVSGRLDGLEWGTWKLFVYNDQVVTGTVRTPSGSFNVRTVGGVHVISQIDTSSMPRFEDRVIPAPPAARPPSAVVGPDSGLDTTRTTADPYAELIIDIAVAYTEAAVAGADQLKEDAGIDGVIDEMIDNAHEAYERSGANLRLRLAWRGLLECSGTACSDKDEALDYIATKSDLRTKYGADLLSWIVDIPRFGGVAHHGGYYSVVQYNQETDHYTFAHELGHNMYLQHDRWTVVNVPEGGGTLNNPYPYSHGYISTNCGWRTIMAYPRRCTGAVPAIKNFSNPKKVHNDGERMGVFGDSPSSGVDGPADAVRSLNEKRREVAGYWHPTTDLEALWALHYSTGGGEGRSRPYFYFTMIQPDPDGPHYARLIYSCCGGGTLPDYIGTFTKLDGFKASNITGPLPATLGNLTDLRYLWLTSGTGRIPTTLGNLSKLRALEITTDRLTGRIPAELGNLSNLNSLSLSGCHRQDSYCPSQGQLTGQLPAELGNLSNLSLLFLNNNQLTGQLPAELGNLSNLIWMYLDLNQLTGEIPAELGNLSNLGELQLDRTTGLCLARDFPLDSAFARLSGLAVCSGAVGFTDVPIVQGETAVKAVHFTELRWRIDDLRIAHGLDRFSWTDSTLAAGVTIRGVHMSELRTALRQAYDAAGQTVGFSSGSVPAGGSIRASHINELRRAVETLER